MKYILVFIISFISMAAVHKSNNQTKHKTWPSAGFIIDVSKQTLKAGEACATQRGLRLANCTAGACIDDLDACTCYGAMDFPEIPPEDQKSFSWKHIWQNVPPVQQNDTRACWAIAAATTLDAASCIKTQGRSCTLAQEDTLSVSDLCACSKKLFTDSECMKTSCPNASIGCGVDASKNGGFAVIAMHAAATTPIVPESLSPTSYNNDLNNAHCLQAGGNYPKLQCMDVEISNPALSPEEVLMRAVYTGPVAVTINFDIALWGNYKGGIFDNPKCADNFLSHVAVVTGWGEENNVPYWELRNSMGPSWGEGGYFRIKRGVKTQNGYGLCGIAYNPTMGQLL